MPKHLRRQFAVRVDPRHYPTFNHRYFNPLINNLAIKRHLPYLSVSEQIFLKIKKPLFFG